MHRKALESLSAVRPSVSRLDRSRAPAELSADLVEAWSGTETSLRALLGGSMLGGAALIHEARQRQMLTFDQANALAAFCAVAGRCANPSYRPSDNDINSTREGFDQFESSLQMAEGAPAHTSPGEAMSTKGLRLSPLGTPRPVPLPPEDQPWWIVVVASVVVIGALGGIGWYAWSRLSLRSESATMGAAIDLFTEGRTVAARSAFEEIVHRDPADADAHTYLARIARDAGDLKTAREHATLAVQAEPGNPVALREMASVLLAARDYELARRFYVRVVEAAPEDSAAQGFLGCTLLKLGRPDEGNKWLERAGPGAWRACIPPPSASGTQTKRSP